MPELNELAADAFTVFSQQLQDAITSAELPSLQDGPRNANFCKLLSAGDAASLLGDAPAHQHESLISGLWLLAGDIDRSHTISQDLPSAEGSFLHGIMHRREQDFGNSKYWFRRVGSHPVLDQIADLAGSLYDDPYDFIDTCSQATGDEIAACKEAQWVEWQCLMTYLLS